MGIGNDGIFVVIEVTASHPEVDLGDGVDRLWGVLVRHLQVDVIEPGLPDFIGHVGHPLV